jgi:hypothetical protein
MGHPPVILIAMMLLRLKTKMRLKDNMLSELSQGMHEA